MALASIHVTVIAAGDVVPILAHLRADYPTLTVASAPRKAADVFVVQIDARLETTQAVKLVASVRASGLIAYAAHGGGAEREALLAAGFDDAVTGATSTREVAMRIRAVHRRIHRRESARSRLRYGAFVLDPQRHELTADGARLVLSPVELEVMRELILARGGTRSREQLLVAAWRDGGEQVGERAVDNVILRLRRKLPRPDALETVRGVGFRLTE